jgi:hypothetical protein
MKRSDVDAEMGPLSDSEIETRLAKGVFNPAKARLVRLHLDQRIAARERAGKAEELAIASDAAKAAWASGGHISPKIRPATPTP